MTQPPNQPRSPRPYQPRYGPAAGRTQPPSQGVPPAGAPLPTPGAPTAGPSWPQPGASPQAPGHRGSPPPWSAAPGSPQPGPTPYGAVPQHPMPQGAVPVGSPPQGPAVPTGHPPAGAPTPAAFGVAGGPGIVIDAKFIPISFFYYFIKPKLVINGREVPATWNRNVVPLPPGRYHVHMHVPYLMPTRVGPVDTELIVQPGRFTRVEYRVPAWSFSPGAIGPAPQKYNGIGLTVAVTLIPLVLMLFILFLGAAV